VIDVVPGKAPLLLNPLVPTRFMVLEDRLPFLRVHGQALPLLLYTLVPCLKPSRTLGRTNLRIFAHLPLKPSETDP
jgi:hypothetical protein